MEKEVKKIQAHWTGSLGFYHLVVAEPIAGRLVNSTAGRVISDNGTGGGSHTAGVGKKTKQFFNTDEAMSFVEECVKDRITHTHPEVQVEFARLSR